MHKVTDLKTLNQLTYGKFKKVVEDLIDWYGDDSPVEYSSRTEGNVTKVSLTIRTASKYNWETEHTWEGEEFSCVAHGYRGKTVVFGKANTSVRIGQDGDSHSFTDRRINRRK